MHRTSHNLVGRCATLLASLLVLFAAASATRSSQKAQHPVHHGRRHRLDAAELLSPRVDGRRDAEHRSHRQRRRAVHAVLRRVELHGRALRVRHRHDSLPRGLAPAGVARRDFVSAPGNAVHRAVPARPGLHDRRVRQEPPRRSSRFAADRARVPGILGLSLSPRCDAAGELPGHQQQPGPSRPSCRR